MQLFDTFSRNFTTCTSSTSSFLKIDFIDFKLMKLILYKFKKCKKKLSLIIGWLDSTSINFENLEFQYYIIQKLEISPIIHLLLF